MITVQSLVEGKDLRFLTFAFTEQQEQGTQSCPVQVYGARFPTPGQVRSSQTGRGGSFNCMVELGPASAIPF